MGEAHGVLVPVDGRVPLALLLLHWWERHGRRDPVQKPWMFTAAGAWPQPHEQLEPYGIWVAEVMRCSAA